MGPYASQEKQTLDSVLEEVGGGGGGLLDLNTSDAGLPVDADDGVLLRAHAVGEVDYRAVR